MTREIFVDTGAWLALADEDDGLHHAAMKIYPVILQRWQRLVTTNLVVAETYNLIYRRLGHKAAIKFLETTQTTSRLLKIYANATLEQSATTILRQYADQDFSYVDAVSFALMTQRNIETAFTFDHHFQVAGFTLAN